jgi:uncharacterized protein (UPF0335 family)
MDDNFSVDTIAADQLKAFVERIERIEEEKSELSVNIKDIYAEAKGNGFDKQAIRKIINLRKKDFATRQEEEAILDLYRSALGI